MPITKTLFVTRKGGDEKTTEEIKGEIVNIDGILFDTGRARKHYNLSWLDAHSNNITGDLYLSPKDIWYVNTPSEWANCHRWEILGGNKKEGAKYALELYSDFLEKSEIEEIAQMGGVVFG